jgi:hypothetical protein
MRTILMLILLSLVCAAGAEEGRYANATGDFALELRAGKAHMSMGIVTESAPYRLQGDKIVIQWDGDKVVLTREKDGSLSGPAGTFFTRLHRKKD